MQNYILWAAILIISLIVEGATAALVSIWFVPASAVCIILEFFKVPFFVQVVVFIVVSAILAFILRKKIKESFLKAHNKTNTDLIIGEKAKVEEDIKAGSVGRVYVGGNSWSAYSESARDILKGETVIIESISGVKLLCREVSKNEITTELIGKTARVENSIDNIADTGTVLCDGIRYPAKLLGADTAQSGTSVKITAVSDEKVFCEIIDK